MASFSQIRDRIADRFKERGVDRLVYFHCDHFEPWSHVNNRQAADSTNVEDIVTFADQCSRIDFARKLTLFYATSQQCSWNSSQDLIRTRSDDPFGFVPNKPNEEQLFRQAMKYLVDTVDHSIQIHIHHEGYTSNTRHTIPERVAYSTSADAPERDAERLALAVRLAKESIRKETDIELKEWFFVHGLWALQGSDSSVCRIGDELGILMREGCRGDFTFPAGRDHVNPKIEVPYFCEPIQRIRGYDQPEAKPEAAFSNPQASKDKFFIWASRVKHEWNSLDYYDAHVRRRLENPEEWIGQLIRDSYYVQGTLFIKTHAHSMQPAYREAARLFIPPHAHPSVQDLLSLTFDAAALADVDVKFASAPEVRDLLVHHGAIWDGSGPDTVRKEVPVTVEMVPMAVETGVAAERPPEPKEQESDRRLPSKAVPAAIVDVTERLNQIACRAMADRIAQLGVDESGAYNFYADRVKAGSLVQPVDVSVVNLLDTIPSFEEYHEVRAGLGVLAMLIACSGRTAVAIESDARRHAASAEVSKAVGGDFPEMPIRCTLLHGQFAKVAEQRNPERSLAIFTDYIATISEGEILAGISRYAAALIDIDRFGVQLANDDERKNLLSRFRAAGFGLIRPLLDLGNQGRFYLISAKPSEAIVGWGSASSRQS